MITHERTRRPGRPRVLICNVFFPPQTYGGATRVVRDNIDWFIDNVTDFDIYVLSSDEGVAEVGRLRFDSYRGVPVFRVSCEIKEGMDWFAFDQVNDSLYARIVKKIDPDLVHFHCMQRLGVTLVESMARSRVPYLITLHDAWWISDHQFLIDDDGLLQLPSFNLIDGSLPRFATKAMSISRKRRLLRCLTSARYLLAVSQPFGEVYRRFGLSNIIVVENGLPRAVGSRSRIHSGDGGRVSLGHIGGRSAHKGATLIEGVLRTECFINLRLTMIDGRMEPGSAVDTTWGTTPVRLIATVPQSNVDQLYNDLNVLLAPSTWPESFGLVAREAAAAGLWVVASNRGAMGDDVVEDVDGFRIDVSSSAGLRDVLRRIDSNPHRYLNAPEQRHKRPRTVDDQSVELARIYRRLTAIDSTPPRSSYTFNPGPWPSELPRHG